jgi:hypothetical protein
VTTQKATPAQIPVETGHWEELHLSWWELHQTSCAFCGRLIPRRVWHVRIAGKPLTLCGPECERLYRHHSPSARSAPPGTAPFGRIAPLPGTGKGPDGSSRS